MQTEFYGFSRGPVCSDCVIIYPDYCRDGDAIGLKDQGDPDCDQRPGKHKVKDAAKCCKCGVDNFNFVSDDLITPECPNCDSPLEAEFIEAGVYAVSKSHDGSFVRANPTSDITVSIKRIKCTNEKCTKREYLSLSMASWLGTEPLTNTVYNPSVWLNLASFIADKKQAILKQRHADHAKK